MTASAARHYDVAVVGAGPVGAVAALAHARRGARVALCEANPSSARRLAGEWLHPPAIQVLRELGIDLPSEISEHARGQGFVVFPDDGSAPCLLPYGDGALGYSCRHQALVEMLRRSAASHPGVEYRPGVRVRRIEGRSLHYTQNGCVLDHYGSESGLCVYVGLESRRNLLLDLAILALSLRHRLRL